MALPRVAYSKEREREEVNEGGREGERSKQTKNTGWKVKLIHTGASNNIA